MSLPEVLLWKELRGRDHPPAFCRQHPVPPYVLDFFCPAAALCVEVDGRGHDHPEQIDYDLRRTERLKSAGIEVLRVTAAAVLNDPWRTAEWVREVATQRAAARARL